MSFADTDLAYAAGLFEGEGSIHSVDYYWHGGIKRARKTPQIRVQLQMTDREPVEKFAKIVNGKLLGPYKNGTKDHHKDLWMCVINKKDDVRTALKAMYPLLSPRRREKIDSLLGGESD